MHNILEDIIEKKKLDLIEEKGKNVGIIVHDKRNDYSHKMKFIESIPLSNDISIIGEIKLASPTENFLGAKEDIITRAISYERAGVNAISFITEKHYFHSDISFIPKIKEKVAIPILQKDFVIEEYQIHQAQEIDSDALLLIARLVNMEMLKKFVLLCQKLDIEPVVEINNDEDLEKAIKTNTKIIAVNARDLETFTIDINNACDLLKKIPDMFLRLGFSGIKANREVKEYRKAGVNGILVGTELMKAENIKEYIGELKSI